MFRRFLHTALCASLLAGAALPAAAEAGPRHSRDYVYSHDRDSARRPDRHGDRRYDRWESRRDDRRWHRRDRDHDDDGARFLTGAIIGLAAGAIIAGATRPTSPAPVYRADPGGSLEPWTPEWQDWCSDRYRSFDPRTGFWRGYDGKTYFCRP